MDLYEEFLELPLIKPYAYNTTIPKFQEKDILYVDLDSVVEQHYRNRHTQSHCSNASPSTSPHRGGGSQPRNNQINSAQNNNSTVANQLLDQLAFTRTTNYAAGVRSCFDALLQLRDVCKMASVSLKLFYSGATNEFLDFHWQMEVRRAIAQTNLTVTPCLDACQAAAAACMNHKRESGSIVDHMHFCSCSKKALFYGINVVRNLPQIVENWDRDCRLKIYCPSILCLHVLQLDSVASIHLLGALLQLEQRPPHEKIQERVVLPPAGADAPNVNQGGEEGEEGGTPTIAPPINPQLVRNALVLAFVSFYVDLCRGYRSGIPCIDTIEKLFIGELELPNTATMESETTDSDENQQQSALNSAARRAAYSVCLYELQTGLKKFILRDYVTPQAFKSGTSLQNAYTQNCVGAWVAKFLLNHTIHVPFQSDPSGSDLMSNLRLVLASSLVDSATGGFAEEVDNDPVDGGSRTLTLLSNGRNGLRISQFWPKVPVNIDNQILTLFSMPKVDNITATYRPQLYQLDALRHLEDRIRLACTALLLLQGAGYIISCERDLLLAACLLSQDGKFINVYEGRLKFLHPTRLIQLSQWFQHVYVHLLACNDLLNGALAGVRFPVTVSLLPLEELLMRCLKTGAVPDSDGVPMVLGPDDLQEWYQAEVTRNGFCVWMNPAAPSASCYTSVLSVLERIGDHQSGEGGIKKE